MAGIVRVSRKGYCDDRDARGDEADARTNRIAYPSRIRQRAVELVQVRWPWRNVEGGDMPEEKVSVHNPYSHRLLSEAIACPVCNAPAADAGPCQGASYINGQRDIFRFYGEQLKKIP